MLRPEGAEEGVVPRVPCLRRDGECERAGEDLGHRRHIDRISRAECPVGVAGDQFPFQRDAEGTEVPAGPGHIAEEPVGRRARLTRGVETLISIRLQRPGDDLDELRARDRLLRAERAVRIPIHDAGPHERVDRRCVAVSRRYVGEDRSAKVRFPDDEHREGETRDHHKRL